MPNGEGGEWGTRQRRPLWVARATGLLPALTSSWLFFGLLGAGLTINVASRLLGAFVNSETDWLVR